MKMQKAKYIIYQKECSFYHLKCVLDSDATGPKDLNNLHLSELKFYYTGCNAMVHGQTHII